MDDDVRQALEELRGELEDQRRARTPAAREEARGHVREARADLNEVLRENGYRLTTRELDAMMDEREERKFEERLNRHLDRIAQEAEEAQEGEEGEEGGEDKGSASSSGKPRRRRKPTPTTGGGDEEAEEWK